MDRKTQYRQPIKPNTAPRQPCAWSYAYSGSACSLQYSTGGKAKLLGISKRGNKYIRKLLIHGARAALPYVAERNTPLGRWAKALLGRVHPNVAVVALANKLARIAWAVLRRGETFTVRGLTLAA